MKFLSKKYEESLHTVRKHCVKISHVFLVFDFYVKSIMANLKMTIFTFSEALYIDFAEYLPLENAKLTQNQEIKVLKFVKEAIFETQENSTLQHTVWKLQNFSLTPFWQKFRESNGF